MMHVEEKKPVMVKIGAAVDFLLKMSLINLVQMLHEKLSRNKLFSFIFGKARFRDYSLYFTYSISSGKLQFCLLIYSKKNL